MVFKNEKVILGKSECLCSFKMQDRGDNCSGKAKCDSKCSGTGKVEIGIFLFNLKVKKRKSAILKCQVKVEPNLGTLS